jgi:parvulin-like peptidyl-prolyl isomerase
MFLVLSTVLFAASPAPVPAQAQIQAQAAAPATAPALSEPVARIEAPLFSTEFVDTPVAKVGDEVITLRELSSAIASAHADSGGMMMGAKSAPGAGGKKDFKEILDRLITLRLIAAEAREMGFDELDEVKNNFAAFRAGALKEAVRRNAIAHVTADPKEVEQRFQHSVREWKVRSVLFEKEDDAKAFAAAVRDRSSMVELDSETKTFDALAEQWIAEKKATGGELGWVGADKLTEAVHAALLTMRTGSVSGAVVVAKGYTVLRLEEIRYPENDEARAKAEAATLARLRKEALDKYNKDLAKKWVKVDRALLKALDYHGVKKYQALAKDQRPVARIQGEKPITVAELSAELTSDLFHGVDRAVREKQLNNKKQERLDAVVAKRLYAKVAREDKIAESDEFRRIVAEYEDGVLFGLFVQRVVLPDIEVMESEIKAYYEAHAAEYSYPRFYKLDGLAFAKEKDAQKALSALQKGTDFAWVRANAENQLPAEKRTIELNGATLSEQGLPPALATALSGSKPGDVRLYAPSDAEVHVVRVLAETPPGREPYVETREAIAKKLYNEKVNAALKDYAAKLRAAGDVKVYVTSVGG